MNQATNDPVLTDVDLFSIIGSPAISFLSNDCRELMRLL